MFRRKLGHFPSSLQPISRQKASFTSGSETVKNFLVKSIEDEIKGTIGKALGDKANKIRIYAKLMDDERVKYEELLEDGCEHAIQECAMQHNKWRKECLNARWELIMHRETVGFTVGNQKYVMDKFPVRDELPVNDTFVPKAKRPKPKQSTDQLSLWSWIGRWNE